GGAEVGVAADLRVAAADVRIGFTQATLAIMPAWGGAERLAALVGRSQALLLVTTGDRLDAAEAHRIGLIDRVYPREAFEESWLALAKQIAASPARPLQSVIARAGPGEPDRGLPRRPDQVGYRPGCPAPPPRPRAVRRRGLRGPLDLRRPLGRRRRPRGRLLTHLGRAGSQRSWSFMTLPVALS